MEDDRAGRRSRGGAAGFTLGRIKRFRLEGLLLRGRVLSFHLILWALANHGGGVVFIRRKSNQFVCTARSGCSAGCGAAVGAQPQPLVTAGDSWPLGPWGRVHGDLPAYNRRSNGCHIIC